MDNWKRIFKSWAGIPVLILAALVVIWFFVMVVPRITVAFKSWQAQRAYDKMLEPYYKDTFGGKTPEETYDLFISALKKGDIELASKYFTIERQGSWLETLEKYDDNNYLESFVKELENTKEIWVKSNNSTETTASFKYRVFIEKGTKTTIDGQEVEIPPGDYINESVFSKYPTGIWKIEGL